MVVAAAPKLPASTGFSAALHPLHAILLAFPVPLFLGALLSDYAYWSSFQVQWINFSSWLIAGGLVGGGFALLWAFIDPFRRSAWSRKRRVVSFIILLVMWVVGFINALVHAKDAWATMPEGLLLSAVTAILAAIAAWIGFSGPRATEIE